MATTVLVNTSNRWNNTVTLLGTVTGVALDAIVNELFTLPAGFGDLVLEYAFVDLTTFSGAYVAVAPATEAALLDIYGSGSLKDTVGVSRLRHYGTGSARPFLAAEMRPQLRPIYVRQNETFHVSMPIMAGVGVTGAVDLLVRGIRLRQA